MKPWAKQKGFTIVELLIVIVVIGILAAITIVAYNGIQARARDNTRKQDLAQIAKALHLYAIDNDNYIETGSGCGASGNGNTLFNYVYASQKSIAQCLIDAKVVQKEILDPSGTRYCASGILSCFAYMKYTCSPVTYVYAHLETIPQTSADTDSTCAPNWDSAYGMNYFVRLN